MLSRTPETPAIMPFLNCAIFFDINMRLALSVDPIAYASDTPSSFEDFPSTTIPSGDIRSLHFFSVTHFIIVSEIEFIRWGFGLNSETNITILFPVALSPA